MTVWTIGHSNLPSEVLLDQLKTAGITLLVDIRRFPMSRRNPQFNSEALAQTLTQAGFSYRHASELGGRRKAASESINLGLRDPGFRGFADYMGTDEFAAAIEWLESEAERERIAIMCAEAVPWRCHRSLISDCLVARQHEVRHLYGRKERPHTLSPHARVQNGRVVYPSLL